MPGLANLPSWSLVSAPPSSFPVITLPLTSAGVVTALLSTGDYTLRYTMTNGSFSNYDDMVIHVGPVLPVTLVSFTGTKTNDKVLLTWKTTSEINNDYFNIERSFDGAHFQVVGKVNARATPSALTTYNFEDVPGAATEIYYRLQQVDVNRKFAYSEIVRINMGTPMVFTAWPNPVQGRIHCRFHSENNSPYYITLYGTNGQVVHRQSGSAHKGVNEITLNGLPPVPGVLLFLEFSKDGRQSRTPLFKKQ